MKTSKIRSDSKLLKIPAGQREQLKRWLIVDNFSYEAAALRLKKEFGVHASISCIGRFWDRVCSPSILRGEIPNLQAAGQPAPALEFVITMEAPNSIRLKIFTDAGSSARINT